MSDGSEYVSNHDRGAFGKLLAEARESGAKVIDFRVRLEAGPEDEQRWAAQDRDMHARYPKLTTAHGRTGEEALRRLVEKLRG